LAGQPRNDVIIYYFGNSFARDCQF
jgi:hypothetical protein